MKKRYKNILIKTEKDLKRAERLHSKGWKVILGGFNSILLEK